MKAKALLKSRGFTLIELIIVVAILAILAAAIVPNFMGFDQDARISTTKSNLETLRSRINLYRQRTGGYPNPLSDLEDDTYEDAGADVPYIRRIPVEMVSDLSDPVGDNTVYNAAASRDLGGWFYDTSTYQIWVNIDGTLTARDSDWNTTLGAIDPQNDW